MKNNESVYYSYEEIEEKFYPKTYKKSLEENVDISIFAINQAKRSIKEIGVVFERAKKL